jgi:hypothetical protein
MAGGVMSGFAITGRATSISARGYDQKIWCGSRVSGLIADIHTPQRKKHKDVYDGSSGGTESTPGRMSGFDTQIT